MPVTQGCLETSEGLQLPLEGTDVRVEVTGPLAEVSLEQTFINPLDRSIEATYQFPLPHGAAVYRMRFEVNGRVVENVVKELEAARRDFARARQEGRRATLLEQQKPNLFTMAVTHIQPGETIKVTMGYFEMLEFEEGRYRWTFPMVAADRHPGDRPPSGDPEQLRARRLAGRQRARDVQLRVDLGSDEAFPNSPTHELSVQGTTVSLAPGDALPNRDFVLYWTALPAQVYLHRSSGGDGTFLFQMLAPQDEAAPVPPQDLLILVDRSCSMRGQTMEQARRAVDHVLSVLRPEDGVQIVAFDHDLERFAARGFESATPESVARARGWMHDLAPRGGTELELALREIGKHPGRGGSVLLITDAAVGNEEHLLTKYSAQDRPLHVLGLGAAVNRYLVEKLARQGEGTCQYLTPFEDPTPILARLGRRLLQAAPTLSELRLEWPEASLVYPQTLPPLYERQPLVLVGRFRAEGPSTLVLRGKRQDGREYRLEKALQLPAQAPALSGLERLWAQRRIAASKDRQEIVKLAVRYSLASPYTAFVGVDSAEVNQGAPTPVRVAVEEVAGSPPAMRKEKVVARRAAARCEEVEESLKDISACDFGPMEFESSPAAVDLLVCASPMADPFGSPGDPFAGAMADPFGCPPEACFSSPSDPFGPPPEYEDPFSSPTLPPPPLPPELGAYDYSENELAWAQGRLDGALDLVFLVDETGSMGQSIQTVQQHLLRIVETISGQPLCRTLKLGLVRYRDHPPQDDTYVTKVHALTDNLDEIRQAVLSMRAEGGGDAPEAVTDGLFELVNLNWRPGSVRTVVWIGDAPPHGVSQHGDGFAAGCPCGRHWYAQAESCREMGIAVHGVICGRADEETREVFKLVARTARGLCVTLERAPLLVPLITGVAARDLDRVRIEARVAELLAANEVARKLEREDQVEYLWARLLEGNVQVRCLEFTGQVVRDPAEMCLTFRGITSDDVEGALAGLEFRSLELAPTS